MKTTKKQIKKELKKVTKLVSNLTKKKVKKNQENLVNLYQGVRDIKTVVKYILKQKNFKIEENITEENEKDLVVE